jgi:hypothetical protein
MDISNEWGLADDPRSFAIDHAFNSLYNDIPTLPGDDRAAALEAAMVKFIMGDPID